MRSGRRIFGIQTVGSGVQGQGGYTAHRSGPGTRDGTTRSNVSEAHGLVGATVRLGIGHSVTRTTALEH